MLQHGVKKWQQDQWYTTTTVIYYIGWRLITENGNEDMIRRKGVLYTDQNILARHIPKP